MPIYEYLCKKCNNQFELYLKSSTDVPVCPNCGSKKLEKKISGFVARDSEYTEHTCKGKCDEPKHEHCCCGGNCGCHHHHG